ncbi:hypothetical protein SMACR_07484 [Sordaria macrospora]|uniref:WGS project CABT00000000 data, contig 2.46 n=2 Tax=Sordaria macrospora TaxID=5147 RepID=F7W8R2_SORMK|nr:uncharacterized protein SMAC_07484 [Sordaria macrospora k-hell]KAA8632555.1 hypothetical protein SMACR_07484 [Sordaria macrospora]WPJ65456.1 hypothetical protein SMAC4_07484 [Sordaria macrospora]CCC13848.1 unnamed protein product [Sordaria macrospora k-hell]
MAKKSTKRSAVVAIAQTQKLEQNAVDDAKIAGAESNAAVVVDSTLPLPKPVSQSIAMPAENDTPSVPATEGETTVKVKKIILHLPSTRVRGFMAIVPVDIIMDELIHAKRGKSHTPTDEEIYDKAIKWFNKAYYTGTKVLSVWNATREILEHLDSVIMGKLGYSHNKPHGKALERLELQQKFLRALQQLQTDMIADQKVLDMVLPRNKLHAADLRSGMLLEAAHLKKEREKKETKADRTVVQFS